MKRRLAHLIVLLAAICGLQAVCSSQDIPIITEYEESTNGSRSLHIHGTFIDADSVYVELFHDGELVDDGPWGNTWDYTLSEYDYYIIRFTDEEGRRKYLHIIELSDNIHESIALLTIDFRRKCNLILRKSSNGRPDFMLEEVGLDR